ncbi:hypothetical protein PORCAN_1897 [Porphyromonas crevioricanis JCM 13913]|nr:hypothetical protein PORCAN_1897 [Porphyromonas crevioricanis JCM 13913]
MSFSFRPKKAQEINTKKNFSSFSLCSKGIYFISKNKKNTLSIKGIPSKVKSCPP